jgi:hypothetical protein
VSITTVFTGYADEATAKTDLAEFVVGSTWRADKVITNVTLTGETGFCLSVTTPDVRDDLFEKTNATIQIDEELGCVVRTKIDTLDLATTVLTKRTQNSAAHVHSATGLTWHRPLMPDSFWHFDISAEPLHPNSAGLLATFLDQVAEGAVGVNSTSFSSPCWTAKLTTTPITLQNITSGGFDADNSAEFLAARTDVLLRPEATYAAGTDREFSVFHPSTSRFMEFWKGNATSYPPITGAVRGGYVTSALTCDGTFPNPTGVAASGLTMVPGQPTPDEVLYTGINHAVGISIIEGETTRVPCWPANRTDGTDNGFNNADPISEGMRLRLKSSFDVDGSSLHPYAKAVARAAQTYGLVVWDRAGTISLRNENQMPRTNAGYDNLWTGIYDGTASFDLMDDFPFDQCEFMQMDCMKPDWVPTHLPSCVARYSPQREAAISLSGTAVLAVYELSGCAHHASSPIADPVYSSSSWTNGASAITHSAASNNYLTTTGVNGFRLFSATNKLAFFMPVRITADTSCRILSYIATGETADDNNDASFSLQWVSGGTGFRLKRNSLTVDVAASINTDYNIGFVFDGTNVTPYLNGVAGTPVASTANFGEDGAFTIGGYTVSSAGMTGRWAEVVVCADEPSAGDLTSYFAYSLAEFGV